MALDRKSIEKRDFPTGRRGYDQQAVDAHLARIADEVDELRRRPSTGGAGGGAPVAQAASDQVRAIIEAAEASAAGIVRSAHDEAQRIRAEAVAAGQAHIAKVRDATEEMVQRVQRLESELQGVAERPAPAPVAVPAPEPEPEPKPEPEPVVVVPDEPPAPVEEPAPAAPDADVEGARLVALNMALSGTSREETDRYLAENFALADREALLDEVYATVES